MEPKKLIPDAQGVCRCPKCSAALAVVEGQPVRIVDGKLNMEDAEGYYFCKDCNSAYRRLLNTEYYQWYKGPEKKIEDLAPVKFHPDAGGRCTCPVCSARLTFVEGQAVRIVDGQLNMKDSEGHYHCEKCKAVYRRLVNTDYYQWYAE